MKEQPKVSVIMSTYKTPEKYLKKSIDSILKQSYKNIEFIIVCDGAVEDYEYIKKYRDNRIRAIMNESNKGLAKSLNDAINISTGKYIVRMDSDDVSLKNRIKIQVKYMEENKNIIVSDMRAKCFGESNDIKYTFNNRPNEMEIQLLYKNCLIHPATIIRKQFFDENNIRYNEEFKCSQDFELWTRLAKENNIAQIKRIGLKYRIHNKQISISKKEIQNQLKNIVLERNAKKLKGQNTKNTLLFLNGEKNITLDNFEEFLEGIEELIKYNSEIFGKTTLKKVLYNRIFQLIIRDTHLLKAFLKDKTKWKYIFTCNNIIYIISKVISRIIYIIY